MNAKNNRLNHNFQLLYLIVGKCHTADSAYAVLKDLQQDRELALDRAKSSELRTKAKQLSIQKRIKDAENQDDEIELLEAKADLMDMESDIELSKKNIASAQDELDFINKLLEKVQPHRKYKELSDRDAFEACQSDEWKYELIERATSNILLTGSFNPEDYKNILRHPESDSMLNQINDFKRSASSNPNLMLDTKPVFQVELEKEFDHLLLPSKDSSTLEKPLPLIDASKVVSINSKKKENQSNEPTN